MGVPVLYTETLDYAEFVFETWHTKDTFPASLNQAGKFKEIKVDPIADMLVRISNANHKLKETVDIPSSKIKVEVARVMKEEGYISNFRVVKEKGTDVLRLNLKYTSNKERVIQGVKRISKSSLRKYSGHDAIPYVQNGLGTAIISTSKGLMADHAARSGNLGGEVLCTIW